MSELTIFYDGLCPLCAMEMRHLQNADREQRISFEDLHAADFRERFPHIDRQKAQAILYGELRSGELLLGLDVTHKAWSLAGRGWLTAPLRWPVLRLIADVLYRGFARHRHRISRLLTGRARLEKAPECGRCKPTVGGRLS